MIEQASGIDSVDEPRASLAGASVAGETEVPLRSTAERPTAPRAGRRASPQSGIERRRAAGAVRNAPGEGAHTELPTVRPTVRALLATPTRTLRAAEPDGEVDGFAGAVAALLFSAPIDETLAEHPEVEQAILSRAARVAALAYPADRVSDRSTDAGVHHEARDAVHRALLAHYQMHVRLPHHGMAENQFHPLAVRLLAVLERPWERDLLARADRSAGRGVHSALTLEELPADPAEFTDWFKRAAFTHPLYEHPLYGFLSSEASRPQLERFLSFEAAGEAAFDDLVALGQVGTRGEVKIEMGRNYWDEMGNGKVHAVHTHLFHRLIDTLGISVPAAEELPWQVLNGINLMLWSCVARRNAFRAQGTLGAVELLAPQRCTRLTTGARRVGIPKKAMVYYAAHAIVDIGHAEGWLDHVVGPQVAAVPEARVGIAEGLLARADASLDYFDYALATLRA